MKVRFLKGSVPLLFAVGVLANCGGPDTPPLDEEEIALLATLGPLPPPRRDPTNAFEDDLGAWELGRSLFYDRRMSADGRIACADCHDPRHGWSDSRPLSRGVGGRLGRRHASTLIDVGQGAWQFWDGRADSLWSQPLQAIENPLEMDASRVQVARFVARYHRADYERVFGPLPEWNDLPERARPGEPAWDELAPSRREAVERVFANVGKALAAFVRTIECRDTALDRYLAGDAEALTDAQLRGARLFVRDDLGRCIACHSGPNLSDDFFHNLGIPQPFGALDRGRNAGIEALLSDPFNGAGSYSDDVAAGRQRLRYLQPMPALEGAFKTPTLRGVTQRPPYGHLGSMDLDEWIAFHERGGGDRRTDRFAGDKEGTLRPIDFSEQDENDLRAFLVALECPEPSPRLLAPIGEEGASR